MEREAERSVLQRRVSVFRNAAGASLVGGSLQSMAWSGKAPGKESLFRPGKILSIFF
jgi:hypothetical protein